MPTSVFFRCSGCDARIKAPVNLLGRWRTCPGCQRRIIVRDERGYRPRDAEPVLVGDDGPSSSAPRPTW